MVAAAVSQSVGPASLMDSGSWYCAHLPSTRNGPGKIRTYMPRYTVEYSSRYGRYRYTDAL